MEIAAIAGSLREGSYNRALLDAARDLAPEGMRIEIHDLSDIPLFNEDVERAALPPSVSALRATVAKADGFLVATPEYNHGVPGVLKNAFDWLSRPPGKSVLGGKPTAILGASPGMTGSARGQSQLRQSFVFTNTPVLPQPEVLVARAHEKFDADGQLTDETTRKFLRLFLNQFASWVTRFPRTADLQPGTPARPILSDRARSSVPSDERSRGDRR